MNFHITRVKTIPADWSILIWMVH